MDNHWDLNDPEDLERLYEESKKAAFEYYKEHKNLNVIYYSTTDKNLQNKLINWQQEFHELIMLEEKKNMKSEVTTKEEEPLKSNTGKPNKSTKLIGTTHKNTLHKNNKQFSVSEPKKHSFLIGNNVNSQLQLAFGSKLKGELEEEFLDLDEMVEMDFPKEYNNDISNILLKELGQLLNENREAKSKGVDMKNKMKNDDFRLLLCLLRLKKADLQETCPYYSSYKLEIKDLYTNNVETEEEEVDIEEYVRDFIESEIQY
jgi:hypothetical protein